MSMFLQQLVNGVMLGCSYGLIGIGYTIIFGVLNTINFAHGEIIMAASFIGLCVVLFFNANIILSFVVAMIAGGMIGVLIHQIAFRPLRGGYELAPLITTLGVSIFITELFIRIFRVAFGADEVFFQNPIEMSGFDIDLLFTSVYIRLSYFICMVISFIMAALLYLIINHTRIGRAIRATAENRVASQLVGVNPHHVVVVTFFVASALGGIAGVLIGITTSSINATMGVELTLKGLVVIVLGGMGSFIGALAGGVILGVLDLTSGMFVPGSYRDFIAFGALFLILVFKPSGFFGKKAG